MKKPFFTIVIPTLNEENYLPLLLDDIAQQTYRDYEVVIVDGNSNDGTVVLAKKQKKYLPSLSIRKSTKRHVCTQRNLGAKSAKGDWLVFMDADDRLPSYFLQGLKYRLEQEAVDLASCYIQADRDKAAEKTIATIVNYALELSKNTKYFVFPESMTIARRDTFLEIGGFDETTHYAESRQLIHSFVERNKKVGLFKDPSYSFSLRRLRKYGMLELASRMAKAHLFALTDKPISTREIHDLYPMRGGSFFDQPLRKKKSFVRNIAKIFEEKTVSN